MAVQKTLAKCLQHNSSNLMKKFHLTILFLFQFVIQAQTVPYNILFDDSKVNAINIYMSPTDLETLYDDLVTEYEFPVLFVYDDGITKDSVEDTGFRLRGNTSLTSYKKSFKISFNTFNPGSKYKGVEKLNLIGNHNDPTMSREKLYFDLYNQFGLPERRVSFVRLFINDEYYGLYTNVEEYDEIFLKDRFGESTGNLFKCLYGSNLDYEGGSASDYPSYELQTNEDDPDYSDLISFIEKLQDTPDASFRCVFERVFNVEDFLKIYALDIATGHWDNYGVNQNNYYLYHNMFTGQMEFLSYDCDNTIGIDWLGEDWATRNIYSWNYSDRPLVERIMAIDVYKDKFSYYLNQLFTTIINTPEFTEHIYAVRDLIAPYVEDDPYHDDDYGYTYDDFYNGFNTNAIDGHTPYGITNFLELRSETVYEQLDLNNISPIISDEIQWPSVPDHWETFSLSAHIADDENVESATLYYSFDNITFSSIEFLDDGLHGDGAAGDSIYGNYITGSDLDWCYYYIEATDNEGALSRFPVCDANKFIVGMLSAPLVINEVLAKNNSIITDESGDYDDYIEIFNKGNELAYLGDKYLSDEFDNPSKWKLPDVFLDAGEYLIIWADDEAYLNEFHCDFKIDGDGDEVGIFGAIKYYFNPLDTVTIPVQTADISYGRLPNGTGHFKYMQHPTPGYLNDSAGIPSDEENQFSFMIAGNPAQHETELQLLLLDEAFISIQLFSINGEMMKTIEKSNLQFGEYSYSLKTDNLSNSLYFIVLQKDDERFTYKFINQ